MNPAIKTEQEVIMIRESLDKVLQGSDLSEESMLKTMNDIIDGKAPPTLVASFLTALRMKGESVEEITGAARAVSSRTPRLTLEQNIVNIDRDDINIETETIIKTGNTKKQVTNTFNVSTATTFVVAAAGLGVVRHGNWSTRQHFGTADVLKQLGINLDISRSDVERSIHETGVGFLFTPLFQGPMKSVAGLREELGIRTIFNLVGPLVNPAAASSHVLGVYEPPLTDKMAQVFNNLGVKSAMVVCGQGTLDEISICGTTRISQLAGGEIRNYSIEPETYGFKKAPLEELSGGDVEYNAESIKAVLEGENSPKKDVVVLNAAAAFVASEMDSTLEEGVRRAEDLIASGMARERLDSVIRYTNQCEFFVRKEIA